MATAIRGAIIAAKMAVIPIRRGYWGNKIGKPHTVPAKMTGKCGSVTVRLVPAPRGAGALMLSNFRITCLVLACPLKVRQRERKVQQRDRAPVACASWCWCTHAVKLCMCVLLWLVLSVFAPT